MTRPNSVLSWWIFERSNWFVEWPCLLTMRFCPRAASELAAANIVTVKSSESCTGYCFNNGCAGVPCNITVLKRRRSSVLANPIGYIMHPVYLVLIKVMNWAKLLAHPRGIGTTVANYKAFRRFGRFSSASVPVEQLLAQQDIGVVCGVDAKDVRRNYVATTTTVVRSGCRDALLLCRSFWVHYIRQ